MPLQLSTFCLILPFTAAAPVIRTVVMPKNFSIQSHGCVSPPVPPATVACTYAAFRIPGFVNAGGAALLVFAEGRINGCGDYAGVHDMVMRRSTDDGKTWEPMRTLVDARDFWKGNTSTHGLAVWDPTPVFDASTNQTFLFFGGPGRTAGHRRDIWAMQSADYGATWTSPQNMSSSCGRKVPYDASQFFGLAGDTPSDGSGTQLSSGRLIIPMYAGKPDARTVCYSDDHGEHWQTAHTLHQDATEGEVVELFDDNDLEARTSGISKPEPRVLYTIRAKKCARLASISNDGGLSWGAVTKASTPTNIDPACKGGITRWNKGRALVFANPASCTSRVNTTVRLSTDNGRSWPHSQLLDVQSGYTTPQMIDDEAGLVGVVYEQDSCQIALAVVDANKVAALSSAGP